MIKTIASLIVVLFCVHDLFSQNSPHVDHSRPPQHVLDANAARAKQADRVAKAVADAKAVTSGAKKQRVETAEQRRAKELLRRDMLEQIKDLFSAPPQYQSKYAAFLKGKNTGITRIFPDRGCDNDLTVSAADLERCDGAALVKGAGSLYSFRLNKEKFPRRFDLASLLYVIGQADIRFVEGKFVVGSKSVQSIIADIGDVELADLTLKSDGVEYLRSYKPATTVSNVAAQNQIFLDGVTENGYIYSTSAMARPGRTYVLRSIAFKYDFYNAFWNTDLIVAFKVVEQEKDGSVIFLWKELKESLAPLAKNK